MSFPKGFLWGTSVSAAQIEGGWDEGGKSPVMLDYAGDTMFRGAYPSYAPRIWAENGVSFEISGDDRHRRRCECPATIHPGDTGGAGPGMEKLLGPDHTCSKTRDQGGFGWQRCESHRRAHPLSGYGARPLIIN